ncbi:MAG TPA: ATP-binding protein, partial [Xanthobacteraceae bacterium]
ALLADEKAIALSTQGTTGVYVEGDRTRLQQVIVNLIDNAIKYTHEGGTVEVSVWATLAKALELRVSVRKTSLAS